MAVPTNQMVLEFVSEQQRKVVFLQSFKLHLDKGHGHYQAFLEAMQTLNIPLWMKFIVFIQDSNTTSEEVTIRAIQDALSQFMTFPNIETMESFVENRLTEIGKTTSLQGQSAQKQKRKPYSRRNSKPNTEKPSDPAPMPMPLFPQLFPSHLVDQFKRPYPIHPMMQMHPGLRHPMMNPMMTGQMPPFLQPGALPNKPATVQNTDENTNN